MVATKDRIAASDSPQTCCTNCNTVFEIPQELLSSPDTRVRCGECLCIFDAMEGLAQAVEAGTTTDPVVDQQEIDKQVNSLAESGFSDLDVTYSDFDLFSEEADLPEVAYLDETNDAQVIDFDAVDTADDHTFGDTMFQNDVTINADIPIDASKPPDSTDLPEEDATDDEASAQDDPEPDQHVEEDPVSGDEPLPALDSAQSDAIVSQLADIKYPTEPQVPNQPLVFNYVDDIDQDSAADAGSDPVVAVGSSHAVADAVTLDGPETRPRTARPWWLISALALLLAMLLGGLYVYQERDRLSNDPLMRPLMVKFCWALRCELPAFFDPDKIRVLGRHVYSHPEIEGALVANVVFRNEAEVDQRYPILLIKLSDVSGRVVASRHFRPEEYLSQTALAQSDVLRAKTSLDISLEIRDPGTAARSFEMEFR